ncbi:FYVE zinc finger-domain-containing protein [Amylocystis lapponica]|nr:FYVE zinc finger-domain-containing protein [Amylocystis lapponica]
MASPSQVPYQAYRSKRHSKNLSNPLSLANVTPPPSRPQSIAGNGIYSEQIVVQRDDTEVPYQRRWSGVPNDSHPAARPSSMVASIPQHKRPASLQINHSVQSSGPSSPSPSASEAGSPRPTYEYHVTPPPPAPVPLPSPTDTVTPPVPNGKAPTISQPVAGPSSSSPSVPTDKPLPGIRKSSTFRHIPLRAPPARHAMPSSPLRPTDGHMRSPSAASTASRQLDQPGPSKTSSRSSTASSPTIAPNERALPSIPAFELPVTSPPSVARDSVHVSRSPETAGVSSNGLGATTVLSPVPVTPPVSAASPNSVVSRIQTSIPGPNANQLSASAVPSPSPTSSPAASSVPSRSRTPARSSAPYRPGFQPKGVYRPRTDEFVAARTTSRSAGRIEQTRLERRLEKLINLHFPSEAQRQKDKEKAERMELSPARQNRRLSSIFDLDLSDLKTKSAGDLWREVVQTQGTQGGKNDIRVAEQTITPWEDDARVSQCPLCSASFHPLTNRKHHCRLCGRIICSLPVKFPQRPQTCSLLFVTDSKTGKIEEVGEGVDYGVRRRSTAGPQGKVRGREDALREEEKFLKGVRICHDCRPALLRQQYKQEVHSVPVFAVLYDAFISLEKEIEDQLPHFQELMLSLSKHERPTPEASAARKRLLEAFAQYDGLSKRIRQLPCAGGPGSSQDRIQMAIHTRANLFLQKHMFPLQSLPKPKHAASPQSTARSEPEDQVIDPDSEVAHVLQPLLEQEALLETFVEEAKAHRKFEDAKTLKVNLQEIRAEIDRILVNAEGGMSSKGKAKANGA